MNAAYYHQLLDLQGDPYANPDLFHEVNRAYDLLKKEKYGLVEKLNHQRQYLINTGNDTDFDSIAINELLDELYLLGTEIQAMQKVLERFNLKDYEQGELKKGKLQKKTLKNLFNMTFKEINN